MTYTQSASPVLIAIWPLDLEIDEAKTNRWFTRLTKDEQERANRFVDRKHQRRFVASRYQLRQILGQLCDAPGNDLRFGYGVYGKPELLGVSGLHFSVAHSHRVGIVATCAVAPVGVDLELYASREELACHVLTKNEISTLQNCSGDKAQLFLEYWTAKEAFLKLWGVGLSLDPTTIEIDWEDPPVCRPLDLQLTLVKSAWLSLAPVGLGTICAIACTLPPLAILREIDHI